MAGHNREGPDLVSRLERAEARVRDLSVLNEFAATLLHYQTDIDDILWDVCNQVMPRMGLEDCVVYLLDEDQRSLVQRAAYGPKNPAGREILAPILIEVGDGVVGWVAAKNKVARISDTRFDPRYICDDQMRLSELAVPIVLDGKVIGVIDSEHSEADYFSGWHEELFGTLARMVASRIAKSKADKQLRELNLALEQKVAARTTELAEAHRRSEQLLNNLMPASIAARIKAGETRIADRVDEAAVLFADIVNFTRFAATSSPDQVVDLLDAFFLSFDQLAAEAGAEKIKTVGDATMIVMGVPRPCEQPAAKLARLALRLSAAVPALRARLRVPFEVRFGLHSGPVVAGVIGRHRSVYDLWGDTVNLASRLEATGQPGRVHIAVSLAERLGPGFQCSAPRDTELKGLGPVPTCFLLGERGRHQG